jgi:hypothetical protein
MTGKYVSIFTLAVVVLSGVPLISGGTANYVNAKYSNSLAQSFDNGCRKWSTKHVFTTLKFFQIYFIFLTLQQIREDPGNNLG